MGGMGGLGALMGMLGGRFWSKSNELCDSNIINKKYHHGLSS